MLDRLQVIYFICKQTISSNIDLTSQDLPRAVEFLSTLLNKLNQVAEKEAYSLCLSEIAWMKLRQGNLDEAKTTYEKVQGFIFPFDFHSPTIAILEGITGADPVVYSSFYRGWAMYYKVYFIIKLECNIFQVKVQPTEFYKNSLLYLVYTPIETINIADQQAIAFDMGIAALVSKDIHNFGELVKILKFTVNFYLASTTSINFSQWNKS